MASPFTFSNYTGKHVPSFQGPPNPLGPYFKMDMTPAFQTNDEVNPLNCTHAMELNNKCASGFCTSVHSDMFPQAVSTDPSLSSLAQKIVSNDGQVFRVMHNGNMENMTPLPIPQNLDVNCSNTLKSIWHPERFLANGDMNGYYKAKAMQSCFAYDVSLPNGQMIPVMVKNNKQCLAAAAVAMRKAGTQCNNYF